MSPNSPGLGPSRSAAAVNEDIRALVEACGGWLYGETRELYQALVLEWWAAERAEIVKAA